MLIKNENLPTPTGRSCVRRAVNHPNVNHLNQIHRIRRDATWINLTPAVNVTSVVRVTTPLIVVTTAVWRVGAADSSATRTPCVGSDEQNTARLTSDLSNTSNTSNTQTNLIYLNARSLKSDTSNVNEIRDFNALNELSDSDIFGIADTWLNSNILNSELFSDQYTVYRKDREEAVAFWWHSKKILYLAVALI